MRCRVLLTILVCCGCALGQPASSASPLPDHFEIGERSFFDFGPPFNYYTVFLVRSTPEGTSVKRIIATPPGNACLAPANVEVASAVVSESIATLLANGNPCSIPEKELRRELKRCKKCPVFSGAVVAMQFQCGTRTRIVRSDILDRDIYDANPKTPQHTSWTMRLLEHLDRAVGPGVMEKPAFAIAPDQSPTNSGAKDSELLEQLKLGKYDNLFQGAPDKPSEIYEAAQRPPRGPTVEVVTNPLKPEAFIAPIYPPVARAAHVEGTVAFTFDIDAKGTPVNFAVVSGHPMLIGSVKNAVERWRFAKDAAGQQIHGSVKFGMNCPSTNK